MNKNKDKFGADAKTQVVLASDIPDGWMGLDIGPSTIAKFTQVLEHSITVVWVGAMGVCSFDKFAVGTEAIATKICQLKKDGVTTIGARVPMAVVRKFRLAQNMSHMSTGDVSILELLKGKSLRGVRALDGR